MKRIVYTLAVGKSKFAECALGLGRSLKLIGDDTRRVVVTDQLGYPWERSFDEVLTPEDPAEWVLFSKFTALKRTDADQVLFIDGDSLAFKRLQPIFEHCQGRGLCVQGQMVSDGNWYGDVKTVLAKNHVDALPTFNGGLIYYERSAACADLIESCWDLGRQGKSLGFQYENTLTPEEPYLSLAMAKAGVNREGVCHIMPQNLDYSNAANGLVGKLDLDVLKNRCQYLCRRSDLRFVQPYVFHASRYIFFATYWKQLDRLRALEKYEMTHGYGYMSPMHKLARSINRRYLKYVKRVL